MAGSDAETVTSVREFAQRTGLLLRAVVALLGAACLSRWWGEHQGGSPPASEPHFDNSFFRYALLINLASTSHADVLQASLFHSLAVLEANLLERLA